MIDSYHRHAECRPTQGWLKVWIRVLSSTAFGVIAVWNLVAYSQLIDHDGALFRLGALALFGADPFSVASPSGLHLASPPLTLWMLLPVALLPSWAWLTLCVVAALFFVRRFGLPPTWVAYPPLVIGILLGNPSTFGLAIGGVAGIAIRPHLAVPALLEGRARDLVVVAALLGVTSSGWFGRLPELVPRYVGESGPSINAWGSVWFWPVALLLALLALVDRRAAGWLAVPSLCPNVGWYAAAMVLPVSRAWVALIAAVPLPGAVPLSASLLALDTFARQRGRYLHLAHQLRSSARLGARHWISMAHTWRW